MSLLALPAFSDNYIWALVADGGRAIIVDPGEAGPVLAAAGEGLEPSAILLTHHHHDHVGGVTALRERWPDLPVVAPHDDRITTATLRVGEGEHVEVAGRAFDVMEVPGHTLSHIAYTLDDGHDRILFSGDTLFSLGCGRLFEGSPEQMLDSLTRLAALPDDTRLCCGHEYTLANATFAKVVEPDNPALQRRAEQARALRGDGRPTLPTTLGEEKAANPFLRTEASGVLRTLRERLGRAPADRVEAFAELRRWKDGFVA